MPLDESAGDEIRRFEEQFKRQPDSLVFARLADALRKAGDPRRALEVLDEGIRRHSDYLSAHIVRARTYRDLGRLEEARSAFERVIEIDARNLVAIQGLAEIAREENDTVAEISWTEQLVLADPQDREPAERLEQLRRQVEPAEPHAEPGESSEPRPDRDAIVEPEAGQETWWSGPAIAPGEIHQEPTASPPEATMESESEAGDRDEAWWFEPPSDPDATGAESDGTGGDGDDADLLTRTMAELYARQGLIDEAEAIYRELLRDRPEDGTLRDGLDAVLGMRAARGASRHPESGTSEPAARPGPEIDAEQVESVTRPETAADRAVPESVSAADFLVDLLRAGEGLAPRLPEPPDVPSEVQPHDPMTGPPGPTEGESGAGPAVERPVLEEWLRGLRS